MPERSGGGRGRKRRGRGRGKGDSTSDDEWGAEGTGEAAMGAGCAAVLVWGPGGVGKSASVGACAKAAGFRVLEVNAGTERTGAGLLRAVGEASQSRGVGKRGGGAGAGTVLGAWGGVGAAGAAAGGAGGAADRTLLVLEEVDTLGEDERGFAGALAELVGSTKRPVVLTARTARPACLGAAAGMPEVRFGRPTDGEVAEVVACACVAMGAPVSLGQVQAVARGAGGDVRGALLSAQLWLAGANRGAVTTGQSHGSVGSVIDAAFDAVGWGGR